MRIKLNSLTHTYVYAFKSIYDLTATLTSLTAVGKWATAREYAHNLSSMAPSNTNPFPAAAAVASSAMRLET